MPDVVLRTSASTAGTTPSNTTRAVVVEHDEDWRLKAHIGAENPLTGAFQGNAEVVLEEVDSSGGVTQTVAGTISSVGELNIRKIIHKSSATGLPGGAIKWQSTTRQARVLVRYSGTNKNLTIRIRYREMVRGAHEPRHRQKNLGVFFPDDTVVSPDDPEPLPDDEIPPGDDAGVEPPPEEPPPPEPIPGVSPLLVVWPEPDRPTGTGVALETKATMETALPTGWTQVTTGATLTRVSGSVLTGTFSMRSFKATP